MTQEQQHSAEWLEVANLLPARCYPCGYQIRNCRKMLPCPQQVKELERLNRAGLLVKTEDQTLPGQIFPTVHGFRSHEVTLSSLAKHIQQDMIKAGFVKVVER